MTASGARLGFAFDARADGSVAIRRDCRVVTILRGGAASRFLARAVGAPEPLAQAEMARVTGNYRRGNERRASAHPRNGRP